MGTEAEAEENKPPPKLTRLERTTLICKELIELTLEGHELKYHGPERICRDHRKQAIADIAHGLDLTHGDMDDVSNLMAVAEEHCAHEPSPEDDEDENPNED